MERRSRASSPSRVSRATAPPADGSVKVDAYLARLPADQRVALEQLRRTIRSAAPGAVEVIGYRMPAFCFHGALVYYAAFPRHLSFLPGSGRVREEFPKELERWSGTKSSIHFTPTRPLPVGLVRRIVKWRLRENLARKAR